MIITSDEHLFYVLGKGFIPASELKSSEQLVNLGFNVLKVVSNKRIEQSMPMYNFEVADYHTYAVSEQSVWVHNMCLPAVKKAVNSNMPHAVERGVERGIFDSAKIARERLKQLSDSITKNGFPDGTIKDTIRDDRVLVPVGEGGYAVYQIGNNGTAKLKTVLIKLESIE